MESTVHTLFHSVTEEGQEDSGRQSKRAFKKKAAGKGMKVSENKRAGEVYSLNVCGFSRSAAAGHRAALDAEYFILL